MNRNIYLAARYDRRLELLDVADQLVANGYNVTSRWLLGEHEGQYAQDISITARFAQEDLADIIDAGTVIHFTEFPQVGYTRGGRHVEFGFAVALGKQNIIIGPCESVFHYLPSVIHYPTLQDFYQQENIETRALVSVV